MKSKKITQELIGYIHFFEKITRVHVKDCFLYEEEVIFIVDGKMLGKAVGKQGVNAKRLAQNLRKRVKIVAFDDDVTKFVQNLIYPVKSSNIYKGEDNIITIKASDYQSRALIIGRDSKNLKVCKEIVSCYFEIQDIKVSS